MKSKVLVSVLIAVFLGGCRSTTPVKVIETGRILACEDGNENIAHGLPYVTFFAKDREIDAYKDGTMFVFSSHDVPPCSAWQLGEKYEMTVVQHADWRGRTDSTWDLVAMRALKF